MFTNGLDIGVGQFKALDLGLISLLDLAHTKGLPKYHSLQTGPGLPCSPGEVNISVSPVLQQ